MHILAVYSLRTVQVRTTQNHVVVSHLAHVYSKPFLMLSICSWSIAELMQVQSLLLRVGLMCWFASRLAGLHM
jgi:hypothetical protein